MDGGFVLVLMCMCAVISHAADNDHGSESHSLLYNEETFPKEIAKKNHFVMFFAPWCGYCKRMAPTWEELAEKYNKDIEKTDIIIAKVDCTLEVALCAKHDVNSYPTLKLFRPGVAKSEQFKGKRSIETFERFIKDQLSEPIEMESPVEAEGVPPKKPDALPPVVNGLVELSDDNFDYWVKQPGYHFIKFYAPWCGHCRRLAPVWDELAKHFEDDKTVTIGKIDCTSSKAACAKHSIKGYPTMKWFGSKTHEEPLEFHGNRDIDSLKQFVSQMKGDHLKPFKVKSKSLESPVTVLTNDNFEEATATGVTFVKFYAPWCGHCKALAPIWEDLAKKYMDNDNVMIAEVDCTVDSVLCAAHRVQGYPTLLLYNNGVKINEHDGARDLKDLTTFVNNHLPHEEL